MQNRKAQATVWIIVSIVILGILAFLFMRVKGPSQPGGGSIEETDTSSFIDKCIRENAESIADEMIIHGGFIYPKNYKIYNNISVEYLCVNKGFFRSCINQHAAYISEMENELNIYLEPKIAECFKELDQQLQKKNGEVMVSTPVSKVLFAPGKIRVEVERNMSVSYKGIKTEYSKFDSEILHPIYDLAVVARDIVNGEARDCYIEYVGYMSLHPSITIRKTALGDSTKIYEIEDDSTKKKLTFAIRGCAIPAGI